MLLPLYRETVYQLLTWWYAMMGIVGVTRQKHDK